jgi:hypothetical protein
VPSHPRLKPLLSQYVRMQDTILSEPELRQLIDVSGLSPQEKATLFEDGDGVIRYLNQYPQSVALLELAQHYLERFREDGRLTNKRLLTLSQFIGNLPVEARSSIIPSLITFLGLCIHDSINLSLIVATFSMTLEAAETNQLINAIADDVRDAMVNQVIGGEARSQDEMEHITQRFSALLQFALCADTVHDLYTTPDQKFSTQLLYRLLNKRQAMSMLEKSQQEQLFRFVNTHMVEYWPADLRTRWQEEEPRRNPAYHQAVAPSPQDRLNNPANQLLPSEAVVNAILKEKLDVYGQTSYSNEWVSISQQIPEVMTKMRLKELALFFIENRIALTLHQKEIDPLLWKVMVMAHDLYILTKKVQNHQHSKADAHAIAELARENRHLLTPIKLSKKEQQLIAIADGLSNA